MRQWSIQGVEKWGAYAPGEIEKDPYILCARDIGVPFEKADEIARQLGFAPDSPERSAGESCMCCGTIEQRPHLHPGGQAAGGFVQAAGGFAGACEGLSPDAEKPPGRDFRLFDGKELSSCRSCTRRRSTRRGAF